MAAIESDPSAADSITIAGVVSSAERIVVTKSGKLVTSFRRDAIRSIRIARESASEQPTREVFWALLLSAVGGIWAARTLASDQRNPGEVATALVLVGIGVWIFVHVLRRVPQLKIQGASGLARILLDRRATQSDLVLLQEKLTELGYPVI